MPQDHHGEEAGTLDGVRSALRERVKELTCIYDVSDHLADDARPRSERLQAVVDRIPAGWQYPERAAARLALDDGTWASAGWSPTPTTLRAEVRAGESAVGTLEVVYVTESDDDADAAFLQEERLLIDELARRIGAFLAQERGRQRVRALEDRTPPEPVRPNARGPQGLIGASPAMQAVYRAIEKAARTDATLLVLGESGTGKELVARAVHYASARAGEPFVPVNCAAIPDGLVESELFGYVKGAFTGASHARAGFFQTAQGGTIFLDEIGEMDPALQAKLLRVLESDEIRMVGSDRTQRADVRVVAATNQDVAALVEAGRFRADLYFRLNVLSIELPPLRERGDDLVLLLDHFRAHHGAEHGGRTLAFTERALARLRAHDWPGNVRELQNLVRRLAVMSDDGLVDAPDLPLPARGEQPAAGHPLLPLAEVERRHVRAVLRAVDGNRTEAARVLGIDRKTLRKKLAEPE